ncbi:hypothetical protein DVH24_026315 [Malus domestica]|uniref:Uncharacterized protein n=1 Tax=Malus domestica TaxID=3750 RepID=A0A498KG74_MALDO|nr:hypothetical protein DVH24_026315 [Malus domestica]
MDVGNSFYDCRWFWAPRSANMKANRLASRSCVEMCDFTSVDRPPSSLVHHTYPTICIVTRNVLSHVPIILKNLPLLKLCMAELHLFCFQ